MTAEEIKALKGRGWLLNKGTENFSARIVTVGGRGTTEQMQQLEEKEMASDVERG